MPVAWAYLSPGLLPSPAILYCASAMLFLSMDYAFEVFLKDALPLLDLALSATSDY